MPGRIDIKRIIFSLVIVLLLVMMAVFAANLPPIDAEIETLRLECDISPNPTEVGNVTDFMAAASGGEQPYFWLWTVNGEPVATTQNTAYSFIAGGNYTVCITVTDSAEPENEKQCCTPVTVDEDLSLECGVSPNPTKVGHVTDFTAAASGGIPPYSWSWTVNGTEVATDQNTTYNFTAAGDYTVCVNVTDSSEPENEKECCTPVTVNPALSLECSVSPNPTEVGQVINFNAAASGGVPPYEWLWTVNGTEVATIQNTVHTFATGGTYNVCVNVTDSLDNKEGCCTNVTVSEDLSLECWVSPNPTKVGHITNFTAAASGGNPPYSWSWTVNEIAVATTQNTTYTFATAGPYTVCVNVTDSSEPKNEYQCYTPVTVNPPLSLECDISLNPTEVGQVTNFYAGASGGVPPYSWLWTVNGESVATTQNTAHTFATGGTYNVCVNVTDSLDNREQCCTNVTVTAPPPTPGGGGGGGGGCPPSKYLTVDWDGNITKKPLYPTNDRLTQDLLGHSPDGRHSLLLEQGTHAPTVDGKTHYLIIIRELEEIPPLPENTTAIVAINATPAGAFFDRDIFLTLGFDELPGNALNATMAYYNDVNGVWVPLESEPGGPPNSVAELSLSAPINHFSIFGVLVELAPTPPPPPAHFVPSGLSIVTSVEKIWGPVTFVTKTGESVTITANVRNDGGQEGTYTVELKLNGETVETKTVTLGAGESQLVSFTVSGLDYGQHEVEVAGLSDEFTTSRTITWWPIIVIIVAIGLISWGVVWIRRRRRPAQEG